MTEEPNKEVAKETKEKKQNKNFKKEDNTIFVGGKPFMNYVTGVVMQFTTQDAKEIVIKARGKFISRAVDIAEVSIRRFLENTCEMGEIKVGSEEFQSKEGKQVRVSTIDITLIKK